MPKQITLVTSGHLSSCPRLVKEAKYFLSLGHQVNIVCIESIERIYRNDIELAKSLNCEVRMIQWNGNELLDLYFKYLSVAIFYLSNLFFRSSRLFQKNTYWLYKEVSKFKSDIIIAHQFNSFAAVSLLKKEFKFVYDVEDAYAFIKEGATINNPDEKIIALERKQISKVDVIIYSSPLYKELYESLYSIKANSVIIYNVFKEYLEPDVNYVSTEKVDRSKISIYWFSQTIGLDRGIQQFLSILDDLNFTNWEVHLRGAFTEGVKTQIMQSVKNQYSKDNIYFHHPISIEELDNKNKEHDIGIAFELTNSLNRDYCISNKLFDYMSAGLSIIYSNTKGQSSIMQDYNDYFLQYNEENIEGFKLSLSKLLTDENRLKSSKLKSRELSKIYNINKEQLKYDILFK